MCASVVLFGNHSVFRGQYRRAPPTIAIYRRRTIGGLFWVMRRTVDVVALNVRRCGGRAEHQRKFDAIRLAVGLYIAPRLVSDLDAVVLHR